MKKKALLVALVIASILVAAFTVSQSYDIEWWSVDGGGGTSSGDGFELSGTIGQPDVGQEMNGGSFSVSGGYWNTSLTDAPQSSFKALLPLLMN
ncbi:MAG TPA: hypothetical protein VFI27_20315 [candidate division Zixibacteria bacterium]|nr:hypothetical protein [candidate division Zixibacteria bacterium]